VLKSIEYSIILDSIPREVLVDSLEYVKFRNESDRHSRDDTSTTETVDVVVEVGIFILIDCLEGAISKNDVVVGDVRYQHRLVVTGTVGGCHH